MKKQIKLTAAFVATGLALLASSANAAVIFSEDWQDPIISETRLDDTSIFAGWNFDEGTGNDFHSRNAGFNSALPGGSDGAANQALQFEWDVEAAEYDTGHAWSADDEFTLSFNATEMQWSNASDRYVTVRLTETFRNGSGVLTGTTIWSEVVALPEWDSNHGSGGQDWSAAQTFNFNFSAADFSGGTEGNALTFEIQGGGASPSNRGTLVDNINLTFVPEPSTTALLGLGGLALILRRRR